jgi:CubicO group peptidase (beta-lactamase class C family)
MQAEVDAGRKTGIVTLIARRGRVAHLKAFGMAERESNTAMRADSLFRLYSMTKPVTSVALLMLYEEGKFQLSDPLEKYIPEFKDVQVFVGMDGVASPRFTTCSATLRASATASVPRPSIARMPRRASISSRRHH